MVLRKLVTGAGIFLFLLGAARESVAQWVRTAGPQVSVHVSRNVLILGTSGTNILASTADSLFISSDNGATWSNLSFPGSTPALFGSNGNELFVITAGDGIFFSSDNGSLWTSTTNPPSKPGIYCFSAIGRNNFVGTSGGGIFRSTDNGLNWTLTNTGVPNSTVEALASIGTTILAGTEYGGIFASNDSGTTWKPASTGLTGVGAMAFGVNGSSIFAATDKGVFLTTTNGASWSAANTGLPSSNVFAFAAIGSNEFAATQGSGIFLSTDNGSSWIPANTGLPNLDIRSLVALGTSLFIVTSDGNMYLSTNNGASWSQINNGYATGMYVQVRALLPSTSGLFAGTDAGVFLTTNNGDNWVAAGLQNKYINALAEIGTNLFAAADTGVYLTTDNGLNWASLNAGFNDSLNKIYGPPVVYSLAVKGTSLFAAGVGYGSDGMYETTDLGTNWVHLRRGNATIVTINNGNIFAALYSDGIEFSSDDGKTWSLANAGMPNDQVTAFASIDPTLFSGTASNGIYLSSNNGASWLPVNQNSTPNQIYSLDTVNTGLFAGTQSGVYLSTNSGNTWIAADSGLVTSIPSIAAQNGYLFAGTQITGVWRRSLSEMLNPSGVSSTPGVMREVTAYPNPFESSITLDVEMPASGPARIVIVNALGTEVAQLFNGTLDAGERSFTWNARAFSLGVYWIEARTSGRVQRTAIILER